MIITTNGQRIRIDEDVRGWYSAFTVIDDEEFWKIEFELKGGGTMSLDCKDKKHANKILKKIDEVLEVHKL